MRRLALFVAALALVMTLPASAEEVHWASYAVASSQYSNGQAGGLAGPVESLASPALNGAFLFEGVLGPALEFVICSVLGLSPCVPEDPVAFANEVANGAAGLPDALEAFVATFPAEFQEAVEAFPGNLEDAVTTTPDEVVYGNWAAMQATGAPNTYPSCGDIATAWAPQPSGPDPEALAVFYDPPVADATRIDIYETNVGGFVTGVEVVLATGESVPVFTGPDTTACPGILSIPLAEAPAVAAVVIHTQASGWEEIDAVGVIS